MSHSFSNNFYERINAIGRWDNLVVLARERGLDAEIQKFKPPEHATWREVAKASEKLGRAIIADRGKGGKK